MKKLSHKSSGRDETETKSNRRSQSLDRLDENNGDSRAERKNRRQYMHLVGTNTQIGQLSNKSNNLSMFFMERFRKRTSKLNN